MTLERNQYDDPAIIYEREEGKSCKGCLHERQEFDKKYCDRFMRHGNKCHQYVERNS